MADTFTTPSGVPVFTDGSAQERLANMLNPRLREGPTSEEERDQARQKAREKVDADPAWDEIRSIATTAWTEARGIASKAERQFQDLKPEAYDTWITMATESHAEGLITATNNIREKLDTVRKKFAAPANPMPLTSVDTGILQVRLSLFDSASPEEARDLVEEAVQRADRAFLAAAGSKLRSWIGHRNVWSGIEAEQTGQDLLEMIDAEIWSPARDAGDYAGERSDEMALAWARFAQMLQKLSEGEEEIQVHRQTGALSPLFEPEG